MRKTEIILGSCLVVTVLLLTNTPLHTTAETYPPTFIHSISVANLNGDIITSMLPNQQVVITVTFMSHEDRSIPFVGYIEVRDNNDITQFVAWQSGVVPGSEIYERTIGISWSTDKPSTYEIRSFAITDLESPQILSFIEIATIVVGVPAVCETRDC